MVKQDRNTLALLLELYEYEAAYHFVKKIQQAPKELLDMLYMLKERRELNIQPAFDMDLTLNSNPDDEQLANYLLDLETKLKKAQIIDFVRAVSPLIYRLFLRLILAKLPEFPSYIHDTKDDRYDTWNRDALAASDKAFLRGFKPERHVTSNSLSMLIALLDYPKETQQAVVQLRQLERSVRNPLAHLIKPFDEAELKRTTDFSSQRFLTLLIHLSRATGVHYPDQFYFDELNLKILEQFDDI